MNFMLIRFVCQAISARKRAAVFNAGCPNSQKTPKRPTAFLVQSASQKCQDERADEVQIFVWK